MLGHAITHSKCRPGHYRIRNPDQNCAQLIPLLTYCTSRSGPTMRLLRPFIFNHLSRQGSTLELAVNEETPTPILHIISRDIRLLVPNIDLPLQFLPENVSRLVLSVQWKLRGPKPNNRQLVLSPRAPLFLRSSVNHLAFLLHLATMTKLACHTVCHVLFVVYGKKRRSECTEGECQRAIPNVT